MATKKSRKDQLAGGFRLDVPDSKRADVDEDAARRFVEGESPRHSTEASERPQAAPGAAGQSEGGGTQEVRRSEVPEESAGEDESGSPYVERAGRGLVRSKLSGEVRRRLTVYLPKDLGKHLDVQAVIEGRNLSDIVTAAVADYLDRHGRD